MKTLALVVALLCMFTTSSNGAESKSAEAFFKRFQVVRSADGKLIGIRDRTLPVKFDVAPYVSLIKEQLIAEQNLMKEQLSNGTYDEEIRKAILEDEDFHFNGQRPEMERNLEAVVESMRALAILNVDTIFTNAIFKEVVSRFEGKITEALLLLDPTLIANVNDSTYFYKRNVTYKAVTWALDFARKRLANIPMLNTASYIIVQVEKLIRERRQFHQNMLLHYLENFKESELGLTHDEVNLIWSSIYESRIDWYAFWESSAAKGNWYKYGVNKFYLNFRMGTANLRNSQVLYSEVGERINYSFQKVTFNNEKVIINLFDKEGMFQNRPAVAYNYDKPTLVARKRSLLTLAQLGLSFVPMSALIKDNVSSFIKSFYEKQKITEGALYGHFESTMDIKGQNQIIKQYLNPFDILTLK